MYRTTWWISWTPDNLLDLQCWILQSNLFAGRDLWDMSSDFLLYTDASTHDWGCSLLHHTVSDLWSKEESALHFYLLELWAVWLAFLHFQHFFRARQWECLQITPQPWHTLLTRGALILRYLMTKLSGLGVGQRENLFLSSLIH